MTPINAKSLDLAVAGICGRTHGPGGALGVVKDGEVILRHAWGYADPKMHLPVTAQTRFPICSISKQFTCGVLSELGGDPERFVSSLKTHLPNMETARPSIRQLCNNQSGLRDYWALTVLHGADAEGIFRREDAKPLFERMRSTHFAPGSRYSYSNGNFRILSDIIEDHSGRSLGELYREKIFAVAGMETAALLPDTTAPADGLVGHEGNNTVGFFPATNRIFWTGDAGISASLDDMVAWERFIDRTRDDDESLYRRLSQPQAFSDGRKAAYGNGLAHDMVGQVHTTGHGGALRGFRAHRLYAPSARLSVVVLFNHEGDAHAAARRLMQAALGIQAEEPKGATPCASWKGRYLDHDTGLLMTLSPGHSGLRASFAGSVERLSFEDDDHARSSAMTLSRRGDEVAYDRWRENLRGIAGKVTGDCERDIAGRYYSRELDAHLEIAETSGVFYGFFEGFLGKGEMTRLYPVGQDVWTLPCRRSMDAPAPGDWTIRFSRGPGGSTSGLKIGCWLARNIEYLRVGC